MFHLRMFFVIFAAVCVAVAGGVMADTVKAESAEETQSISPWVKWCVTNGGKYPLHCAAGYGDIGEMNRLIADGADIDELADNGASPLFFAALAGKVAAINVLVEAGASVDLRRQKRMTPLHAAADNGHVGVIEALVNAGAKANVADRYGVTPLHLIAKHGHVESIKLLINAGASVNAKEKYKGVPLHLAAAQGHIDAIETFVNAGADVNAVDGGKLTPLHLVAKKGHANAVEILVNAGAYHSPESPYGDTPMHEAAFLGHIAVIEALVSVGAHTDALNKKGETPMDLARRVKKWGVVAFLENGARTPKQNKPAPNVATAPAPEGGTVAEHVFEHAWRSVVYIRTNKGQGSGVIIRPNIVATNCHVAEGGNAFVHKAENRRTTETRYRAVIRHADNKNDFCLLDVKGLWGIPANVRRYDTLRVGESVYGLGAPQGLDLSMSTGIISQKRAAKGVRYIQTDVAISPGSSGGGLFDREGNLVGIMTAKIVGEDVEGIGFAIPADLALE